MKKIILYIGIVLIAFTSCHSSKKMVKNDDANELEINKLYKNICKAYGDYETVSLKFAITSKNLKSMPQIKGNMRIKKDSAIWISIAPVGLELVRCMITPDSVKLYSKIQKNASAMSLDSLSNLWGFPVFKTLQSLLLDEMLFYSAEPIQDTMAVLSTCKVNKKNNKIIISRSLPKNLKKDNEIQKEQIWNIKNQHYRITDVKVVEKTDSEKDKVKLFYDDFEVFDSIVFPTNISVKWKLLANFDVNIDYSRVKFNEDLAFPFPKSEKYKKLDLKGSF